MKNIQDRLIFNSTKEFVYKYKISFNGTNCSLYDSSGKLIEGSVNVKDGTSVDYVFHVEDEEQFSVPNEVDIEGKIKEYTQGLSDDDLTELYNTTFLPLINHIKD